MRAKKVIKTCNVKLYGERNTGTNYLQKLIEKNFKVNILPGTAPKLLNNKYFISERLINLYFKLYSNRTLGWKHAVAPQASAFNQNIINNTCFIFIIKNPYSWILSLYKRPYHSKYITASLDEFVNNSWSVQSRENYSKKIFENPMEMWNIKVRSYPELELKVKGMIIKYEELIKNPNRHIRQIGQRFHLSQLNNSIQNISSPTKKNDTNKNFDYYQNYYLNELWLNEIPERVIYQINKAIDWELASVYGYSKIEI